MKEVFLILAHITDSLQENQLRNLVYKLKEENKSVFLATHTYTPEDIVKKCDHYWFDSDNELIPAHKTAGAWYYATGNFVVLTQLNVFGYYNYSIPYSKSLYNGLLLSKQSGYEIVHTLVYDTDFTSLDEFNSNSKILNEYDCVYYSLGGDKTFPVGHFTSFNLTNYSLEELSFDKPKLINHLSDYDRGWMVEKSNYHYLLKPKNHFIKNYEDIDESKLILDLSSKSPVYGLRTSQNFICKDTNSEDTFWFLENNSQDDLNLFIIINDTEIVSDVIKPYKWEYKKIKDFNKINNVKFYKDNQLIHELDFSDSDFKEEFKSKSKFWYQ